MTWVRLDEQFAQHPKVVRVGPLGMALHVAALCYCNQYLTDGFIPKAAARTLIDFEDFGGVNQIINTLVNNCLWDEEADGYRLHDYHDYQPTKQQVIELRTKKQAAGVAGGKASAKAKREAKSNPVPGPVSDTSTVPFTPPTPPPGGTRAEGTNPRAIAVKRERDRIALVIATCETCGDNPNVFCERCTGLRRKLAEVGA